MVDLVEFKAYQYPKDESGKFQEIEIPDALKEEAKSQRQALVELIAEQDDALMEKVL